MEIGGDVDNASDERFLGGRAAPRKTTPPPVLLHPDIRKKPLTSPPRRTDSVFLFFFASLYFPQPEDADRSRLRGGVGSRVDAWLPRGWRLKACLSKIFIPAQLTRLLLLSGLDGTLAAAPGPRDLGQPCTRSRRVWSSADWGSCSKRTAGDKPAGSRIGREEGRSIGREQRGAF